MELEQVEREEEQQVRMHLRTWLGVLLFALLVMPLAGDLVRPFAGSPVFLGLMLGNIPLIVLIWLLARNGRIPLGEGRTARGLAAFRIILLVLLGNLFYLFGHSLLNWLADRWPFV